MTTIAYRDGVIAFDSRVCEDDLILSDSYNKSYESDALNIFYAGDVLMLPALIECLKGGEAPNVGEIEAIVWTGNILLWVVLEQGMFFKTPMELGARFAIGSGKAHAYTAMDMGADAVTAVKMAAKRDKNTGGSVNTFSIVFYS
jgi:hypothetical protein